MRDARVVDEHVEAAELLQDPSCRGGDGGPIRHVELEGASARSDARRGGFSTLEVARPDEHGVAARREIFRDLKTDTFVGPCNKCDGVILHRISFQYKNRNKA